MSAAGWILIGIGVAYLGLIAVIGISLWAEIWREKRTEKKREKVRIV